jgi:hypothetical protein
MMRKCAIALALLSLATGPLMLLGAGMGRADDREGWRREQNSRSSFSRRFRCP